MDNLKIRPKGMHWLGRGHFCLTIGLRECRATQKLLCYEVIPASGNNKESSEPYPTLKQPRWLFELALWVHGPLPNVPTGAVRSTGGALTRICNRGFTFETRCLSQKTADNPPLHPHHHNALQFWLIVLQASCIRLAATLPESSSSFA